ncbi:MAG: PEP-CTERM sorting domain-containing protein, partial [Rubrivivax sp.]
EAGQIVGGSGQGAMLWEGGGYTVLASLGGTSGWANDINEAGQIVGYSEGPGNGFAHATLWDNGAVIDLDPTGSYSTAEGINDQGQVVGSREFGWQAMRWADGTGVVLNDAYATWGLAINSHGVAVGGEVDGNTLGDLALMWGADGAETALSSLVDPSQAILFRAQDINDRGWIAGYALNSQTQLTQAFVLIPVPEPETLVLLMSGLAMLLAIAARRKSRPL